MKKINNKIGYYLIVSSIILFTLVIVIGVVSGSISKYIDSDLSGDDADTAVFIDVEKDITTSGSIVFDEEIVLSPAGYKDVTFKINNTGDTAIKLYLDLERTYNLPLYFTFDGLDTNSYVINIKPSETKEVMLVIKWDSEDIDYIYSSLIDYIVVKATCEQID